MQQCRRHLVAHRSNAYHPRTPSRLLTLQAPLGLGTNLRHFEWVQQDPLGVPGVSHADYEWRDNWPRQVVRLAA